MKQVRQPQAVRPVQKVPIERVCDAHWDTCFYGSPPRREAVGCSLGAWSNPGRCPYYKDRVKSAV